MILSVLILSVLSLILGVFLTLKRNPYGKFLSTIHKICSFLAGVFFCVIIYFKFKHNGIEVVLVQRKKEFRFR